MLIIAAGAGIFVGWYFLKPKDLGIDLPEVSEAGWHVGPVTLYNYIYWTYDDVAQTSGVPTVKFYHSDKTNAIGTISGNTITGQLLNTDKDVIYMAVDHGANTGYFVDPAATVSHGQPYIKDWFPWDYDRDGTLEYGFTCNMKDLPDLTAGQQAWVATLNLYVTKADAPTTIVSITNVTAASQTQAGDYYTSMYVSYTGEGYAAKLAYITTLSSIANSNATYFTNGTLTLKDITMITGQGQSYTIGSSIIGAFDDATNKTKVYPVADYLNEANGISLYNYRGAGGSSNTVTFHWYSLRWPGGDHRVRVTITFYFINPAGTISSTAQVVELRDSYA